MAEPSHPNVLETEASGYRTVNGNQVPSLTEAEHEALRSQAQIAAIEEADYHDRDQHNTYISKTPNHHLDLIKALQKVRQADDDQKVEQQEVQFVQLEERKTDYLSRLFEFIPRPPELAHNRHDIMVWNALQTAQARVAERHLGPIEGAKLGPKRAFLYLCSVHGRNVMEGLLLGEALKIWDRHLRRLSFVDLPHVNGGQLMADQWKAHQEEFVPTDSHAENLSNGRSPVPLSMSIPKPGPTAGFFGNRSRASIQSSQHATQSFLGPLAGSVNGSAWSSPQQNSPLSHPPQDRHNSSENLSTYQRRQTPASSMGHPLRQSQSLSDLAQEQSNDRVGIESRHSREISVSHRPMQSRDDARIAITGIRRPGQPVHISLQGVPTFSKPNGLHKHSSNGSLR